MDAVRDNRGLTLVGNNQYRMSSPGHSKLPSSIRIQRNGFIADIVVSDTTLLSCGKIYHYVIQRAGLPDVVHWGQETSMEAALECVEEFLKRQERSKGA